jgi:hypothetical protein
VRVESINQVSKEAKNLIPHYQFHNKSLSKPEIIDQIYIASVIEISTGFVFRGFIATP